MDEEKAIFGRTTARLNARSVSRDILAQKGNPMTNSITAPTRSKSDTTWLRLINISVVVCALGLVAFFIAGTFFDTVNEGSFKYTADYWYTGSGLLMALAGIGIALGVHRLQRGADGRLGTIGVWINTIALTELFVQLGASVVTGSELRWGPMYVVSTFLAFLGVAFVAAGSWRTGLLPRWMLGLWPLLWILGTFAGSGPIPLVLVAFLAVLAVTVNQDRRATQ